MQQQYRKGDVVMVPGVVQSDQRKVDAVHVKVSYDSFFFQPVELNMVRPHFSIGESVFRASGIDGKDTETVEVLALHDDMVWIRDSNGQFSSVKAIHLKRALRELEPEVELAEPLTRPEI